MYRHRLQHLIMAGWKPMLVVNWCGQGAHREGADGHRQEGSQRTVVEGEEERGHLTPELTCLYLP
jgi:hypothetical protein